MVTEATKSNTRMNILFFFFGVGVDVKVISNSYLTIFFNLFLLLFLAFFMRAIPFSFLLFWIVLMG